MRTRRLTAERQIADLDGLPYRDLALLFEDMWGYPPPIKSRAYAVRRTAWKLRANESGGLSDAARHRLDTLIADLDLPLNSARRTRRSSFPRRPGDPRIGAVLIRPYKGVDIRVVVRPDGYEWNETIYRSLSAAARAITGTRWNGRLFFGVGKKEKSS